MTQRLNLFLSFPTKPLTDWLPNGDGLVAYHIIVNLAQRGHRIHVVTPYADLRSPLPAGVTLSQMNEHPHQPRPSALGYMLWTYRTLRQLKKTMHFDLIHELNPVFSLCSLAFANCGIPVVLGPHSSRWPASFGDSPSALHALRLHLLTRFKSLCVMQQHEHARAILLSTEAALNNVNNPERLVDKLYILPPGIDIQRFTPATEDIADDCTILFLANVVARKGIHILMDAFDKLVAQMPEARLVIAGDGPALPAVREWAFRSAYSERVSFLGRIDREDIPALLRRCTVYCLPSYGEPFGMTALEAMSCGKPLVVTDAGGLGYLVPEQGGRRVPVGDAAALAEALKDLLSDSDMCRRMGAFNRAHIGATYAWPVIAAKLESIYHCVLGRAAQSDHDRLTHLHIAEYRRRASFADAHYMSVATAASSRTQVSA